MSVLGIYSASTKQSRLATAEQSSVDAETIDIQETPLRLAPPQSGHFQKRPYMRNYFAEPFVLQSAEVHAETLPALNAMAGAWPKTNSTQFDNRLRSYLTTERWASCYEFNEPVAVHPNKKYLFQNGNVIGETCAPEQPPHHTIQKKILLKLRTRHSKALHIGRGILLELCYETNYYHALHDVMVRLVWANNLGIPRSTPLIISEKFEKSEIGQQLLKTRLFEGREIVVHPDGQFLVCNNLTYLRPPQDCKRLLDEVAASIPEKKPARHFGKLLVLQRKIGATNRRIIDGYDRIVDGLEAHGYQTVDPASLSLAEQKYVFARASHVVGENGAAFANMIFARGGQKVDTLICNKYATVTFQILAKALGHVHRSHFLPSIRTKDGYDAYITEEAHDLLLQRILT